MNQMCFSKLAVLGVLAVILVPAMAQADTIDTTPLWDGTNVAPIQWGVPNGGFHNTTIGQSFTVPTGQTQLDSFSLQFRAGKNGFSNTNYTAYLYKWTGSAITGNSLWQSGQLNSGTVTSFTLFSFAPAATVAEGEQYIVFLSTAELTQSGATGEGFAAHLGTQQTALDAYSGGAAYFSTEETIAGLATASKWTSTLNYNSGPAGGDLAFTAGFSSGASSVVPEPGALAFLTLGGTLVIVRRRRAS